MNVPTVIDVSLPPASGSTTAHDPASRPLLVAARRSTPRLPSPAPLLTEPGQNSLRRHRRRPLSPAPGGSASRRRLSYLDDEMEFVPDETMHSTPRLMKRPIWSSTGGDRPSEDGPVEGVSTTSSREDRNHGEEAALFDVSFCVFIQPEDVSSDSDSDFSPRQGDRNQVNVYNFYTYFTLNCFEFVPS
jgi:hypothetical protein